MYKLSTYWYTLFILNQKIFMYNIDTIVINQQKTILGELKMKKPNVILVMTDDQGYADLGCTGNPWIKTPNIDSFYKEAVRFNDFHVQPLCTPTRGAIMSGKRPIRNGAWATCWGRSILRSTEITMADVFKNSGYRTGMFGKWHLGDNYPYRPFDRGFEHTVAHKGGGVGQTPDFWGNNYFDDTYFNNGKAHSYIGYCTDIWFERAMDFIDHDDDRPFFAYIATNAPHSPYLVDDKYAEQYRNNPDIVEPEFYGMITNIDENFGNLMKFLDQRNLTDNTILIFMTDNGSSGSCDIDENKFPIKGYNAGLRGKKGSYYDGGHKVPFIIRWPNGNITGGKDINEMALDIDLIPTFIDLCGLENPDTKFDGTSFAETLNDEPMPERTHFLQIIQSTDPPNKWRCCVMTKDWRLVGHDELYNIKADPGQKDNVIDKYPEIAEKLRKENNEWWDEAETYFNDICALSLGAPEENPTTLVAMDLNGDIVWQQPRIVDMQKAIGHWKVKFEKAGKYRFSLRRWPKELPLPIEGTVSKECSESLAYGSKGIEHVCIRPNRASLEIFGKKYYVDVDPTHESANFEIEVDNTGKTDLEAWFLNDDEGIVNAYYVEVELL